MKSWIMTIAATSLGAFSWFSFASNDHQAFKDAEKIARSGNYDAFKQAMNDLDHPLKPYAEQAFYKRYPSLKYQQDISHYLSVYDNTPLEWPVRKSWLEYLQRRGKKSIIC